MRNLIISLIVFSISFHCASTGSVYLNRNINIRNYKIGIISVKGYNNDLAENKTTEMFLSKGYNIIERSQINKLLQEQAFQMSGATDNETAIKAGQIVGVDAVFIASVSYPVVSNTANWQDNTWQTYSVSFSGRLLEVSTGKTILSGSISSNRGFPDKALIQSIEEYFRRI